MKDSKQAWVWVGVAVVVVIVAIVTWAMWKPTSPQKQVTSTSTPVYAPQGQLVPQFPKGLILDPKAAVSGSYSINYASSTNQYTAEYNSSSTMASLYKQYQAYLPKNNWTVTGSLTTKPSFEVIAASQGSNQLQIVISTIGKGSQVTISYVIK